MAKDTATGAAFAAVVAADAELLRIEFDAIIAANFPAGRAQRSRHPPRRSGPLQGVDQPPAETPGGAVAAATGRAWAFPGRPGEHQARQRSPPPRRPDD
ncbi:hypothetical protein [Pseudonocardia nigra]|uniref:hypothetical protein n=1 Tax=Pseudonocardia nigra TaxID=1921578 RepID=UPI001C60624C|nr:hypothetical protein [Pseudonocardia nigra]